MTTRTADLFAEPRDWFVYIRRSAHQVGLLAGPFASRYEAEWYGEPARALAIELDSWAHFDAFGVMSTEHVGRWRGKLNDRLGVPAAGPKIIVGICD